MTEQISITYEVVLIFCGILFLASFWKPWWALAAWVATLSIQLPYGFVSEFRPAISDGFVIPLLIGTFFHKERQCISKSGQAKFSAVLLVFASFFILIGNTVAYIRLGTLSRWALLNKDAGLIVLMVCYFCIIHLVNDRQKVYRIVEVFVVSGSALNFLAILGGLGRYAFGFGSAMMREATGTRLVGFMVNPSSYGGYVTCIAMVQLALLLGKSHIVRLPRWLQWINLLFLGVAVEMTLSRSAYLGLIAGMLAVLLFHRGRAVIRLIAIATLVVLAMAGVLSVFSSSDASQVFDAQLFNINTIQQRMDSNRLAWDTFMDSSVNLITGVGVGTFYELQSNKIIPLVIHNTYLWILVELGPIGLCLLVAIFYRMLRDTYCVARTNLPERDIAVGVICAMASVLIWFTGTEGLWHRHVWFLFALSQACYRIYLREKTVRVPAVPSRTMRARVPAMSH